MSELFFSAELRMPSAILGEGGVGVWGEQRLVGGLLIDNPFPVLLNYCSLLLNIKHVISTCQITVSLFD